MAQVVPQQSDELDRQYRNPQASKRSNTGPTRSSRGETKDYFIVVSNLPFHLDAASCARYKDVYWRPLKDLVRKVINKEDDGQDLVIQVATPKSVNIEHESPGSSTAPSRCGYAICTVSQELLARRALRWLGGNIWYGWTLSVLICCQTGNECRVLDSRWITSFEKPINLNPFSKVNDSSLLRSPPRSPLPPPFMSTVRPYSKVMMPQTTRSQHRFSHPYNWASTNCVADSASSTNMISIQDNPQHHSYANSFDLYPAINIMIQIEDQSWHPYGSRISTSTAISSLPMSPNSTCKTPFALSPTAESFSCITATSKEPSYSLLYGVNPPMPPVQHQVANSYHLNPNGAPINTVRGTRPVAPSSTLIVRNIHHKITPGSIRAYFGTSGFKLCRVEIKEGMGLNKKKVTAILGLSTAEEAKRARNMIDGTVFEGRKLSCEIMKDDSDEIPKLSVVESLGDIASVTNDLRKGGASKTSHMQMASTGSGPVIANGSEDELSERGSVESGR